MNEIEIVRNTKKKPKATTKSIKCWYAIEEKKSHVERRINVVRCGDENGSLTASKFQMKRNYMVSCLRFQFKFFIFRFFHWGGTIWLAVRLVAMLIPLLQRLYWFSISNKRQQSETVGALGPLRRYHFQNNKWSNEIENAFDFYSIPFAQSAIPTSYLSNGCYFIHNNK